MSRPQITHAAFVRSHPPTTMLKVVVLPAPFGPSSPTISPAPTGWKPVHPRRCLYSFTSLPVCKEQLRRGGHGPLRRRRFVLLQVGRACHSSVGSFCDSSRFFKLSDLNRMLS